MIRIAIYDSNIEEAAQFRAFLDSYFEKRGFPNAGISNRASLGSLLDIVKRKEPGYFKMVFIRVSLTGDSAIERLEQFLREMEELSPTTEVTIASTDSSHAFNAYEFGAKFLCIPFDEAAFSRTIAKSLFHATAVNKRPFPIRTAKTLSVLNLNDITYADTGESGPVIHLLRDKAVSVKGSLQALCNRLRDCDSQFVRAGGSLVVNLDNVRSVDGDAVVFADGEAVVLPVRSRKAIVQAFDTWKARL